MMMIGRIMSALPERALNAIVRATSRYSVRAFLAQRVPYIHATPIDHAARVVCKAALREISERYATGLGARVIQGRWHADDVIGTCESDAPWLAIDDPIDEVQ